MSIHAEKHDVRRETGKTILTTDPRAESFRFQIECVQLMNSLLKNVSFNLEQTKTLTVITTQYPL